jgi:AcrR family transcriptional regulator
MKAPSWNKNIQSRDEQRRIKKLAILETASKLFNEQGYDRTSIEDIAAQLNVSKRTLYYYIDSKEEILFECDKYALEYLNEAFDESDVPGQPALQRFEALMRAYMRLLSTNFGACLVMTREYYLSEESQKVLQTGRRNLDLRARKLIEEGISDGSIAACDPATVTASIFGAFNWVPHWRKTGDEDDYLRIADDFLKLFLNGLAK